MKKLITLVLALASVLSFGGCANIENNKNDIIVDDSLILVQSVDALEKPFHPDTEHMIKAIRTKDIALLAKSCGNTFEDAIALSDVSRAKEALLEDGALCAVMTGSGSAVFGIFAQKEQAEICAEKRRGEFAFAQVCETIREPQYVLSGHRKFRKRRKTL